MNMTATSGRFRNNSSKKAHNSTYHVIAAPKALVKTINTTDRA